MLIHPAREAVAVLRDGKAVDGWKISKISTVLFKSGSTTTNCIISTTFGNLVPLFLTGKLNWSSLSGKERAAITPAAFQYWECKERCLTLCCLCNFAQVSSEGSCLVNWRLTSFIAMPVDGVLTTILTRNVGTLCRSWKVTLEPRMIVRIMGLLAFWLTCSLELRVQWKRAVGGVPLCSLGACSEVGVHTSPMIFPHWHGLGLTADSLNIPFTGR